MNKQDKHHCFCWDNAEAWSYIILRLLHYICLCVAVHDDPSSDIQFKMYKLSRDKNLLRDIQCMREMSLFRS